MVHARQRAGVAATCNRTGMTYLATPPDQHYPWYVRLIFRLQRRKYGQALAPARLWGRLPRAFLALSALYGVLDRRSSPLDPGLRSLLQVRISQVNGCSFCVDINGANGLERGVAPEKLLAVAGYRESPLFSEREKAALAHAEAMTANLAAGRDAVIARLREHYSDDEIIELTALVAFQNLSSKFNTALGVPAQGFCHVPPGPAPGPGREAQ